MNSIDRFKERFDQLQALNGANNLGAVREHAFDAFNRMGIPTLKNEEWKYTRIGGLFNKEYQFAGGNLRDRFSEKDLKPFRLPGHDQANELFFINGRYSDSLSVIRSASLVVISLEEAAAGEYHNLVSEHFGHSSKYLKDGINALNTALVQDGVFIHIKKGQVTEHPVYIYNITDAGSANVFSQPRSLIYLSENAQVQMVEKYVTIGKSESFTSEVMEIVLENDARLEYYKIQNDSVNASQVSSTHIRQVGKSYVHTVTISLQGGIVRNNLNVILEAPYCESHLYGLYLQQGQTHIDNHTIVDNVKPNCLSNELYKGILNDNSTGVFNGKIFVQPLAQKTNAFQSNKNVLISDSATVNTKPQLEIYADDVKCSHGCTVGRLNEEGMFYLRSRGITEKIARSLLLHSFAVDILEQIKPDAIRTYVDRLISERLEFDLV